MERIITEVDIIKAVKVGVEEMVEYKSLDGSIYTDEERCLKADGYFMLIKQKDEFMKKVKQRCFYNGTFEIEIIFIANYDELVKFHKLKYPNDDCYMSHLKDILNEWVVVEEDSVGDYRYSQDYKKASEVQSDMEELMSIIGGCE